MQKSRRRRGLELELLSLALGLGMLACAGSPSSPVATSQGAVRTRPSRAPEPPEPPLAEREEERALEPAPLPLPKGTLVLQIGDSFADALGGALAHLLRAEGLRSDLEFKTPSYIPNWSYGAELPNYLARYQPDLVLITLGANELEMPNPRERAKAVRHLVATIAGRPCVWVAPPLWKPDTGLLQVIRDNVAPCRYLDSNALLHDLPRARDKIHPNAEGRRIWAKVVFDWLIQERVGSVRQPWALKPELVSGQAADASN